MTMPHTSNKFRAALSLSARAIALTSIIAACGPTARSSDIDARLGGIDGSQEQQCDPNGGNTCSADGTAVVTCNPDGTLGSTVMSCSATGSTCAGGQCSHSCTADGVDLIYVVDVTNQLWSFDPRVLLANAGGDPFTLIGTLSCPTVLAPVGGATGAATPFSMAVDRNAVAWVEYNNGEIFNVSTQNASCTKTNYLAQQAGMLVFGMGFVSDTAGGDTEKLFIGGGNADATSGSGKLAQIDTSTLALSIIGNIATQNEYSAELTGTGAAQLWGFWPGETSAFVQQIDKTSGAAIGSQLPISGGLGSSVAAWAFAQWGGSFYIFVTTQDIIGDSSSEVITINAMTGATATVIANSPHEVVGAGVSTCAPVVIP